MKFNKWKGLLSFAAGVSFTMILAASSTSYRVAETMTANVGETLFVGFSLSDTAVARPGHAMAIIHDCGTTKLYKRIYRDSAHQTPRTADSVTVTVPCAAPAPVPPADSSDSSTIVALEGPFRMASQEATADSAYYRRFFTYANAQWTQFGAQWDAGNSISAYERAATFYVWWIRTGDTTWKNRAHQLVVNYRENYLKNSGYNPSPHWSQQESLYLDCKVWPDPASCDAVAAVAGHQIAFAFGYLTNIDGAVEGRVQARIIDGLWMGEKLAGTPNPYVDTVIVQTLSTMNSNGWTPFSSTTCGGTVNYMDGMVYDVLTRIHDKRPGPYNTLIEQKALAYATWAWSTQWRGPSDLSFNYFSVFCEGGGSQTSAPDENAQLLPLFGWLAHQTGNSVWIARGDSIQAGMANAFLEGYRQFSQNYVSSYRYMGYKALP